MWREEGTLTSYKNSMNYLLETYTKDDMNAKTNKDELHHSKKRPSKTQAKYGELLWSELLRFDCVNDDYVLNGFFIERLNESICQNYEITLELKKRCASAQASETRNLPNNLLYGSTLGYNWRPRDKSTRQEDGYGTWWKENCTMLFELMTNMQSSAPLPEDCSDNACPTLKQPSNNITDYANVVDSRCSQGWRPLLFHLSEQSEFRDRIPDKDSTHNPVTAH